MATHQSVEEILAKAREEQTKKLDAISALATARQAVITAEANHKKRLEDFKRQLDTELKTIKDNHARSFHAAVTAGNTPTELRKLGLTDPRTTKRAPRTRPQANSPAALPAEHHESEDHHEHQ
ncbi:PIN domain-containing protein [Neomicrococcus lactis]|uniref:Uncharacterized protein n=1 Tax=Neomicrococcus lactis TaxID=732241 RepID=A0A7W8YD63_9MICC|nr:hypothetical protein [Neomicrococcus lactis]MBB5599366.1 hypothetical protein [Neomicrococcus lactis]